MVNGRNIHQISSYRVACLAGRIVMDILFSDSQYPLLQLFIKVAVGLFCETAKLIQAVISLVGIICSDMVLQTNLRCQFVAEYLSSLSVYR